MPAHVMSALAAYPEFSCTGETLGFLQAALGPSHTSTVQERKKPSGSWKMSSPKPWRSFLPPISMLAVMKPTKPNGKNVRFARKGRYELSGINYAKSAFQVSQMPRLFPDEKKIQIELYSEVHNPLPFRFPVTSTCISQWHTLWI